MPGSARRSQRWYSRAPLVDQHELEELCRQPQARYKVPPRWGLVDELPANGMGKIIRSGLPGLLNLAPAGLS